jgi:DNA-binding NarL/FixJ family response regulator
VGPEEFAVFRFPLPAMTIPDGLTASEERIVRALLEGKSNRQIAKERHVSVHTVVNQLKTIFRKVGVTCRWELIAACRASDGHSVPTARVGWDFDVSNPFR